MNRRRRRGHHWAPWLAAVALTAATTGWAQTVVRSDENLARDRPEAWGMNYVAAATLMTSSGPTPALPPWRLAVATDLGHIPRLSDRQQRIGFNGQKQEDLNKSPVFGRLRLMVGLPANWVAELAYTPSLTIDGAQPRDLFAAAIGRRIVEGRAFTLSARLLAQHGHVRGDITCSADIAGLADPRRNPYDCRAASSDRITLGYYGFDVTGGWTSGPWQAHAGIGAVRTDLRVQVDALTFDVRDRSRLVATGVLPFATLGLRRELDRQWEAGVELLYVPLAVRRHIDAVRENDALTSLRLQLRYRLD